MLEFMKGGIFFQNEPLNCRSSSTRPDMRLTNDVLLQLLDAGGPVVHSDLAVKSRALSQQEAGNNA